MRNHESVSEDYTKILLQVTSIEQFEQVQADAIGKELRGLDAGAQALRHALDGIGRPCSKSNVLGEVFGSSGDARAWLDSQAAVLQTNLTLIEASARWFAIVQDPPPIGKIGSHPLPRAEKTALDRLLNLALEAMLEDPPTAGAALDALEKHALMLAARRKAICSCLTDHELQRAQNLESRLDDAHLLSDTLAAWRGVARGLVGRLRSALFDWDDSAVERRVDEMKRLDDTVGRLRTEVSRFVLPDPISIIGIHSVPADDATRFETEINQVFMDAAGGLGGDRGIAKVREIVRRLDERRERILLVVTGDMLQLAHGLGEASRHDAGSLATVRDWQQQAKRCVDALRPMVHAWDAEAVEQWGRNVHQVMSNKTRLQVSLVQEYDDALLQIQRDEQWLNTHKANAARYRVENGRSVVVGMGIKQAAVSSAWLAVPLLVVVSIWGKQSHRHLLALVFAAVVGAGIGYLRGSQSWAERQARITDDERRIRDIEEHLRSWASKRSELEGILAWLGRP